MDGDPGLPPTEVRSTPDEHAGDENALQEPTSRVNSQVAGELIRKGQALSSQGPESLRSRSDRGRTGRSGARSPSPVGSDRHRRGDIIMYDPQADLARGNPMPQSMTQFNQHVANVHLDPSMTVNQEVTNYQQVNATQNNAQFNQFVNQDTGPMVAQLAEARHGEIIAGLQSQSQAMRREIQKNAEQRMNTMKSEREAEMKYHSAMNTISEQEKQIKELRAMVEQMMQNQQQQPAQLAPAPAPPVQQAPATLLAIPTIPLAASPSGLSNASSHSWTRVGSDPYGKDGSVPAGPWTMLLPETVGLLMMEMVEVTRTRKRKRRRRTEADAGDEIRHPPLPPPNWDQQGMNLGTSPTKLGPAGDQSGHFPTKLGPARDQSGHFPHQTGTSRGSIWALPPPNWDQQGINLGTSPTKLGPAEDQPGHFPHQTGTSRGSIWALPHQTFPHQTGTSKGSIWALPPPNWD